MTDQQQATSGNFPSNKSLLTRFKEASVMIKVLAGIILFLVVAGVIAIVFAVKNIGQTHISDDTSNPNSGNLDDKTKPAQTVTDQIQSFGKRIDALESDFNISVLKTDLDDLQKECTAKGLSVKASLSGPIENLINKLAVEASTKGDAEQTAIANKIDELIKLKLVDSLTGSTGANLISGRVKEKKKQEEVAKITKSNEFDEAIRKFKAKLADVQTESDVGIQAFRELKALWDAASDLRKDIADSDLPQDFEGMEKLKNDIEAPLMERINHLLKIYTKDVFATSNI
jgi:hypothetical protein